jgi:FMN phosphatase YigB (HAD superfamily)
VAADLSAAYPRFGFIDLFAVYKRVADEYWLDVAEAVIQGRLRGDDVRLEAWRRALSTYGVIDEHIAHAALQAYSAHRSNTYAVFPEVLGVVTSLREQFKLAIITNGASSTQWDKSAQQGSRHVFTLLWFQETLVSASQIRRSFVLRWRS